MEHGAPVPSLYEGEHDSPISVSELLVSEKPDLVVAGWPIAPTLGHNRGGTNAS